MNNKQQKIKPIKYYMNCGQGYYESSSWLNLGWTILKHRLYHLFNHGKFMD
jgi:hypothetical protein